MGAAAAAIYLVLIANCALSACAHSLACMHWQPHSHSFFLVYDIVVLHVCVCAPETFLTQIGSLM